MKLSESLKVVGNAFPYYPKLCPVVGGVKACIFLCVVFWKAFEEHDGWLQVSMDDITKLSGLSVKEQRSARDALKRIGVLQERENRLAHLMFYRINTDALDAAFERHGISPSAGTDFPEVPKGHSGELPIGTPTDKGSEQVKDPNKTEAEKRMGLLHEVFRRRPETAWSGNERRTFKDSAMKAHPDDFALVIEYYRSDAPYKRHNLQTLLNNFTGEIDRARTWKQNGNTQINRPTPAQYTRPLTGAEQRQVGIPAMAPYPIAAMLAMRSGPRPAPNGVAASPVQPELSSTGDAANG